MNDESRAIELAKAAIQKHIRIRPQLALILGSGLGTLANEVDVEATIPYDQIPGFPISTVQGHAGRLLLGRLAGKQAAVMQGRFHFYEGYPMSLIARPIRVLNALGASALIVTNAAGGLNPRFEPGDVMLITDHINLMGANPLTGPNNENIGPRFPDMTHAYAPDLLALARNIGRKEEIALQEGVYAAVAGPSFETPAERRYLRIIGADAVGMSTVPEVIAANHAGMRVLGISAITNKATGDADQQPDSHEEVLAMARVAGEKLVRLARSIIAAVPLLSHLTPAELIQLLEQDIGQIAQVIDHTLLKPDATRSQIARLCEEALRYRFASVCINPIHVSQAVALLADENIKVGTVIGFPLGAVSTGDKVRDTDQAIDDGASEVDMVINLGALKEGNDAFVEREIAAVVQVAHSRGVLCKVIIEAGLLSDQEKVRASELARQAGADFVKTSTGFTGGGATVEDVRLLRKSVGANMGVKASGGIRTLASAKEMIAAGANRIGTSNSVAMMAEVADYAR